MYDHVLLLGKLLQIDSDIKKSMVRVNLPSLFACNKSPVANNLSSNRSS